MADIQVLYFSLSNKGDSKSRIMSSWTAKNWWQRRPTQVSDTTNISVLTSRPLRKPWMAHISIRSVPSPVDSPSAERYSRALWSAPRCREPSLSEEIICTMCLNTIVTRKDTAISQPISPLPSQSSRAILFSLESADPSARLWALTCSRSPPTRLSATSGNSSCSSDPVPYLAQSNIFICRVGYASQIQKEYDKFFKT